MFDHTTGDGPAGALLPIGSRVRYRRGFGARSPRARGTIVAVFRSIHAYHVRFDSDWSGKAQLLQAADIEAVEADALDG